MERLRRIRKWLDRRLWAQCVLALVVAAAIIRLVNPGDGVAEWLVSTLLYGGLVGGFLAYRVRDERRAVGPGVDLRRLDRKLWKGQVPEEPREREAMRALVAKRRRDMRRFRWTLPVFTAATAVFVVLGTLSGMWEQTLVLGLWPAALLAFFLWARKRQRRTMRTMDARLGADRPAHR